MPASIEILPAHQIDHLKWDGCIHHSENGLIYSQSFYLNTICDNWNGVVINNYEAVMALPVRKKIGIQYTYEPPFIQQLGLIGGYPRQSLPDTIFSCFRYGDLLLNFGNTELARSVRSTERTNLIIDLSKGYDHISPEYAKDLKYNLRRVHSENYTYSGTEEINNAISVFRSVYGKRFPHVKTGDYANFAGLCSTLYQNGLCFTRKITNGNGVLLCIALFLKDSKRIYNMLNTTTAAGRKTKANELLLDSVIREYAGQQFLFDLEGSDLPGVKSFYEKFGAVNQPYFHFHFNNLPRPLRWLKR
jgi:hypothetical protein